jgi:hypothetical protein
MIRLRRSGLLSENSQRPCDRTVVMSRLIYAVVMQDDLWTRGTKRDRGMMTGIQRRCQRGERRSQRRCCT